MLLICIVIAAGISVDTYLEPLGGEENGVSLTPSIQRQTLLLNAQRPQPHTPSLVTRQQQLIEGDVRDITLSEFWQGKLCPFPGAEF